MFRVTPLILGACLVSLPLTAAAQSPAKPADGLTTAQLDRATSDILKEIHNRGADLYNRGDAVAAYRLYEGALSALRPFVAHRPDVLKTIEDGLNETAKTDGPKIQAFHLHEVIELVRAKVKDRPKAAKPADDPKPLITPPVPPAAAVSGTVQLAGKPLAKCDVTAVSLDQKVPRVFTVTADDLGAFDFPAEMPAGKYAVMVTGEMIPAKFTSVGTSPLTLTVAAGGPTTATLNLE